MKFSLCYKDYDYKLTWSAKREFKRETGRGLWPVLLGVYNIVVKHQGSPIMELLQAISEHVDDIDGAFLLWTIAKQCNSSLTLDEITDGVERVGWRQAEIDSEYAKPYTLILYEITHQIDELYEKEAKQAKKDLCP